jgi:hypothetical protein
LNRLLFLALAAGIFLDEPLRAQTNLFVAADGTAPFRMNLEYSELAAKNYSSTRTFRRVTENFPWRSSFTAAAGPPATRKRTSCRCSR